MKPLKLYLTRGVNEHFEHYPLQLMILQQTFVENFEKLEIDMQVFEPLDENTWQIRCAGYYFKTDVLDETTVLSKYPSNESLKRVWFKVDDYGHSYVGTILFPDEY